jgi:preprotein translocase subunit SecA
MRLFGSEKVMGLYDALKIPEGEEIQHKTISNFVEKAQKKIESNNFAIRRNLLEYDRLNNEQREIIYKERRMVLDGENMHDVILKMIKDDINNSIDMVCSTEVGPEEWNMKELDDMLRNIIPYENEIALTEEENQKSDIDGFKDRLYNEALQLYDKKEAEIGDSEQMREIERVFLLKTIDRKWTDHIDDMDQLKQGIGLQSLGQRDPVVEYKFAGYDMFNDMTKAIQEETVKMIFRVKVEQKVEREEVNKVTGTNKDDTVSRGPVKKDKKIGRNDLCPCGSGKKYKMCCGRNA